MTPDDQKRLGELNLESIEDWTRRFLRERGMPEVSDEELKELLRLGSEDERHCHQ